MNSVQKMKSAKELKVNVRTVADVEVGSSLPTSPPATEQDRAQFQKLLLQMNGLKMSPKGATSGKQSDPAGRNPTNPSDKVHEKEVGNVANSTSDQEKLKKKRGKRSAKKSNKSSPTDSPQKSLKVNAKASDNPTSSKQEEHLTIAENITEGVKVAAASTSSKAIKQLPDSHGKPLKPSKSNSKVMKNAIEPDEPSKVVLPEPQYSLVKQKEPLTKQVLKAPQSARDQHVNALKEACDYLLQGNGELEELDPFEKQPYMLLKAAINLVKPKKKINRIRDLNQFYCVPCDKEFVDFYKHLDKSRESHIFNWKCEMRRRTIDLLPDLSPKHISVLDDLVTSTVTNCKMSEEQYQIAHSLWQNLNTLAKSKFDCSVRWFGSHANGIALLDNTVLNMDLLVPSKEDAASTFLHFISAVEANMKDVERVVATNFAHANISHRGMLVQLSLNNSGAHSTAKLISDYISIDKRVLPLCVFFRYWGKICGVDQGENGSWQGHAFPIMVIHFLQQKQVLPVLHDMIDDNVEANPEIYLDPKNLQGRWFVRNKDSVGKLLFEMFRYYAIEHDVEKHVVSITQFEPYLRLATKWNAKRIAVIDPFQPKHNISRYISANMYDYVHFCLLTTTCVLGILRTDSGPAFGYIGPRPEPSLFDQTPAVLKEYLEVSDYIFELIWRLDSNYDKADVGDNDVKVPELKARLAKSMVFNELSQHLKVVPCIPENNQPLRNAYNSWWVTPYQAQFLSRRFSQEALRLTFSKELCTDNEVPPVTCTSCHKNGHLRSRCPDEVIPKMNPVPPPSKELNALLNQLCCEIFETRCTQDSGLEERKEICNDLLNYLKQFYRDIDLHLFGSSLNGFGGRSSDIDMCLTFHSNPTGEGLNFPALVEEIQHSLKGHRSIYQLVAITTAKVPIVKFSYGRNRIQVDISLYNRLGIMNTQLLHAYSIIDPRVRPLVYMMKCLAKTTGIGDASRGSLSSYAYSLMSLYFLQQVEPPVIPVLQELYDPNVEPRVETIDGANVYFFRNRERLDEVWPYRNRNQSSLGELWLQLLEFYASEKFHLSQRVVCIRKKAPLYKFDKLWTSTNICIEDPFDLNHNLGSGLSKRMNIFIVKTFQKACKHFSSLPKSDRISLEKYYFNENALSVGKPPSDRGCHFCRSIGHVQNDCPQRLRLQQQRLGPGPARPSGRGNRSVNNGRQNQPFENFYNNRGGNRREQGRDNHPRNRDPTRISNLPTPMMMPMHMANAQPGLQYAPKPMNQQNSPKPMNLQNHVVVGSMKPPGFPAVPPGYPLMGPPVRLLPPQMAPQMQPQMPPQLMQGAAPPFAMNRPPVRPFQWQ